MRTTVTLHCQHDDPYADHVEWSGPRPLGYPSGLLHWTFSALRAVLLHGECSSGVKSARVSVFPGNSPESEKIVLVMREGDFPCPALDSLMNRVMDYCFGMESIRSLYRDEEDKTRMYGKLGEHKAKFRQLLRDTFAWAYTPDEMVRRSPALATEGVFSTLDFCQVDHSVTLGTLAEIQRAERGR